MTADPDDILDSLFHGCAIAAYVEQAILEGGRPDMEATRRRAYRHYEDALAARNAAKAGAERHRLDEPCP